jgi:hypothetical protein
VKITTRRISLIDEDTGFTMTFVEKPTSHGKQTPYKTSEEYPYPGFIPTNEVKDEMYRRAAVAMKTVRTVKNRQRKNPEA